MTKEQCIYNFLEDLYDGCIIDKERFFVKIILENEWYDRDRIIDVRYNVYGEFKDVIIREVLFDMLNDFFAFSWPGGEMEYYIQKSIKKKLKGFMIWNIKRVLRGFFNYNFKDLLT